MRINTSKAVAVAALGTASLALIGVGTSATFTSTADVKSEITAGTVKVLLSSKAAGSEGTSSITFAPLKNQNSDFSQTYDVKVLNRGSLPFAQISIALDAGAAPESSTSAALAKQTTVAITCAGKAVVKPISLTEYKTQTELVKLPSEGSLSCSLTFAAPKGGLTDDAQGGTIAPKITVTASDVASALR